MKTIVQYMGFIYFFSLESNGVISFFQPTYFRKTFLKKRIFRKKEIKQYDTIFTSLDLLEREIEKYWEEK